MPVRVAQALLIVPLGLFQGSATVYFSVTLSVTRGDYLLGAWGVLMALADVVAGVRLSSGRRRWLRAAFLLLASQTAFALVKLVGYGESASFVFLALVGLTAAALTATEPARVPNSACRSGGGRFDYPVPAGQGRRKERET